MNLWYQIQYAVRVWMLMLMRMTWPPSWLLRRHSSMASSSHPPYTLGKFFGIHAIHSWLAGGQRRARSRRRPRCTSCCTTCSTPSTESTCHWDQSFWMQRVCKWMEKELVVSKLLISNAWCWSWLHFHWAAYDFVAAYFLSLGWILVVTHTTKN